MINDMIKRKTPILITLAFAFVIALAFALVLLLSACGKKEGPVTQGQGPVQEEETSADVEDIQEDVPVSEENMNEQKEEKFKIPELTYKMAPITVEAEPTEYGHTYSSYVIEIEQVGFIFLGDFAVFNKKTGEECGFMADYDWTAYDGRICVDERPHYSYKYRGDEWPDYWETDRATCVVTIDHKGEALLPDEIEVRAELEYNGSSASTREYTFEVNADFEDIPYNESKVVHGFNLLNFGGEYFVPELNSSDMGGGFYDYDTNTKSEGFTFNFIHVSRGGYDADALDGLFYPVQWDDEKKDFVPYEVPDGYELSVTVKEEGDYLKVFMGLITDMDNEVPLELRDAIIPAYDDGNTQMVIAWD